MLFRSRSLTIIPKFDEYRSAPEVVPSAENTSAHPDLHRDPLGSHSTSPILFGEERIIEARRRRMARDSLQVLDPRAELNQYLCEPLVPTSCPVPIWWKVRPVVQLVVDPDLVLH